MSLLSEFEQLTDMPADVRHIEFLNRNVSQCLVIFYLFCLKIKNGVSLKEIISRVDKYLVSLSSKTYVFEDKVTKY